MDDPRTKTPPGERTETASEGGDKGFVARWARLKREAREHPVEKPQVVPGPADPQAPAPELPPPETLTFDSDYRQFFHPKVGEDVRRTALKKLFSDPRFNVMDGLDVYIDDYSKSEPIPAAMLAGLKQAQNILRWAKEDAEERQRKEEAGAKNVSGNTDPDQVSFEPPAAQPEPVAVPDLKASEPVPVGASDTSSQTRS